MRRRPQFANNRPAIAPNRRDLLKDWLEGRWTFKRWICHTAPIPARPRPTQFIGLAPRYPVTTTTETTHAYYPSRFHALFLTSLSSLPRHQYLAYQFPPCTVWLYLILSGDVPRTQNSAYMLAPKRTILITQVLGLRIRMDRSTSHKRASRTTKALLRRPGRTMSRYLEHYFATG
jgi:hypothetical protein